MSVRYTWVQWNKHKRVYDAVLLLGVMAFIAVYIATSILTTPAGQSTSELILAIRATGSCAIVMLHLILAIGPLARLFPNRFAPLLYNRRHFGVTMFFVGLIHGALVLLWYGSFGKVDPITAMFTMNPRYGSFVGFPFEVFGIVALTILFFMAATSHDFWLKNLSPRWWKTLHMGVYVAYVSLVMHVVLGTIQAERSLVYPMLIGGGAAVLASLHVMAGLHEVEDEIPSWIHKLTDYAVTIATPFSILLLVSMSVSDWLSLSSGNQIIFAAIGGVVFLAYRLLFGKKNAKPDPSVVVAPEKGWLDVASVDEIPADRAKVVKIKGCDRVAVFRHGEQGEKLSAVASVCAHQGGPLGEGKVVDGCITCPWHGYQYLPETGQSPPPYTEKIPTYELRIEGERVMLNPEPLVPGTPVEPVLISEVSGG